MKKIFVNICWIVALLGILVSCEKSKLEHLYEGPWFLAFQSDGMTAVESEPDPVEIPVQMVSGLKNVPVNVDFTINAGSLIPGEDYELLNESQTLTFAPGELTQYIRIQLHDNLEINGDQQIVFTLTATDGDIRIGQPGTGNKRDACTLTVKDDDCPLEMDLFSGKVNGKETTPWWSNIQFPATFTPIEELAPGKIKYHVSGIFFAVQLEYAYNAWLGAADQAEYNEVEVIIDYTNPAKPTMSWEEQLAVTVYWEGDATGDEYWIQASVNQVISISTCDKTLGFSYYMANPDWARSYAFQVKFDFSKK